MSSNDLVRHIKLKYSLVTAIAVIKTKPGHLTIEEHLAILRNKLKPDETELDFETASLVSDDFDIPDQEASKSIEPDQAELFQCVGVESPTILRDSQPYDALQGNSQQNWQFASYSIDEALQLLDDMGMEVADDAEAVDVGRNSAKSAPTHTQEVPADTQLTVVDSTQIPEKIHGIKNNITKFFEHVDMKTVDNDKNSVANISNRKTGAKEHNITKFTGNFEKETVNTHKTIFNNLSNKTAVEKAIKTNALTNLPKEGTRRPVEKMTGLENAAKTQEIDTQETQLYSISEYTQNTHISQSQTDDNRFDILDKNLTSFCKPNNKRKITESPQETAKDKDFDDTQDYLDIDLEIGPTKEIKLVKVGDNTEASTTNLKNTTQADKTSDNTTKTANNTKNDIEAEKVAQASQKKEFPSSQNDSEDDLFDSQSETTIPFKVIEELNKVKSTLKRRERKSTESVSFDSGYRSASQIKSSRTGLKCSGSWVNQSAHTLYDYLLSCPLTPNTAEIIREISQVLGDLIDKLHSEERYPSFLDELLGSVDALLAQLSSESCGGESMAAKDESIQRILLLNTSVHIITSTIEKITTILERLHETITKEAEIYELTHIEDAENAAYVFHTLEVLLQRYVRKKAVLSSQSSSQKSENESMPKRSAIADIWKQKWDPEFKKKHAIMNLDSDVKCVDMKIGEVLNKLVIDCMEGYSLVSFAALQCFNVLQS